jgi:nucleotide-binding universal stress UspA family protein
MRSAPVVAGFDGSPESLAAAERAAREALERGTPLRLLHARPLLPHLLPASAFRREEGERGRGLHEVVSELVRRHRGLEVSGVEVVDTAGSALVAASEEAELVVVGSSVRASAPPGLLPGRVGLHTVARAYSPVLLVRPLPPAPALLKDDGAGPPVPEIVVGVDSRAPAEAALEYAFAAAARRQGTLRAVDARPASADPEDDPLAGPLALLLKRYPEVRVVKEVRSDRPGRALVAAATRAGLLVVGRRAAPCSPSELGPVVRAVLRYSRTTVAVVPEPAPLPVRVPGPWQPLSRPSSGAA